MVKQESVLEAFHGSIAIRSVVLHLHSRSTVASKLAMCWFSCSAFGVLRPAFAAAAEQ